MNRNDVTEMIIEAKVSKGIKWDLSLIHISEPTRPY